MDLAQLGKSLRERREALGIPRAVVGRRVSVSHSYVWLVEQAVVRKGTRPLRPSREVLERWVSVLGWGDKYLDKVLELAGYAQNGSTNTTRQLLLTVGSLGVPAPTHLDDEVLLEEIRDLLKGSELSPQQRVELQKLLRSFIAWLHSTYNNPPDSPAQTQGEESHVTLD